MMETIKIGSLNTKWLKFFGIVALLSALLILTFSVFDNSSQDVIRPDLVILLIVGVALCSYKSSLIYRDNVFVIVSTIFGLRREKVLQHECKLHIHLVSNPSSYASEGAKSGPPSYGLLLQNRFGIDGIQISQFLPMIYFVNKKDSFDLFMHEVQKLSELSSFEVSYSADVSNRIKNKSSH